MLEKQQQKEKDLMNGNQQPVQLLVLTIIRQRLVQKGEVFRYAGGGMSASMDFYMTGYVTKSGESLTDGLIEHFRAGSEYYNNIK